KFNYAAMALFALEERKRRRAWALELVEQNRLSLEAANVDDLVWFEIEIYTRSYAGDPEARRYEPPRSLADLAINARTALRKAAKTLDESDPSAAKRFRDLHTLTRWLEIAAMPMPKR